VSQKAENIDSDYDFEKVILSKEKIRKLIAPFNDLVFAHVKNVLAKKGE
jgi:hypothetical protein